MPGYLLAETPATASMASRGAVKACRDRFVKCSELSVLQFARKVTHEAVVITACLLYRWCIPWMRMATNFAPAAILIGAKQLDGRRIGRYRIGHQVRRSSAISFGQLLKSRYPTNVFGRKA